MIEIHMGPILSPGTAHNAAESIADNHDEIGGNQYIDKAHAHIDDLLCRCEQAQKAAAEEKHTHDHRCGKDKAHPKDRPGTFSDTVHLPRADILARKCAGGHGEGLARQDGEAVEPERRGDRCCDQEAHAVDERLYDDGGEEHDPHRQAGRHAEADDMTDDHPFEYQGFLRDPSRRRASGGP